jgi:hypothetical protein
MAGLAGVSTAEERVQSDADLLVDEFYHEVDAWLFGGVFRVLARHADRYEVELTGEGAGFIGRLKLRSPYRERATRVDFENHYGAFEVQEILREPYSGRAFPGFEDILTSPPKSTARQN